MNTKLYRITMRKIKSLMLVALTLMMGLSMTSCLNSDSSGSMWDGAGIFRVEGFYDSYSFADALGNKLVPTPASLAQVEANGFEISEADFAYFYFKWAEDEATVEDKLSNTTTPQTFDIEIVSIAGIEENEVVVNQTAEEMEANVPETAPVMTLSPSVNGTSTAGPLLFDLNSIIIPIYFNIGEGSEEAFNKHRLVLACDMSEVTPGSTEFNLYLRHDKGDDDKITYSTSNWYAFNLAYAIGEFQAIAGNAPTKLIINAHEDEYQSGSMPNTYTKYEVEYKDPTQSSQN